MRFINKYKLTQKMFVHFKRVWTTYTRMYNISVSYQIDTRIAIIYILYTILFRVYGMNSETYNV